MTQLHADVASQASYSFWPEQADAQTLSLQRVPWARVAAGTRVPKRCPPQRSHHTAELPTCRRSRDKLPSQGRGHPCCPQVTRGQRWQQEVEHGQGSAEMPQSFPAAHEMEEKARRQNPLSKCRW